MKSVLFLSFFLLVSVEVLADDSNLQSYKIEPEAGCTLVFCPGNPCCNTCHFDRWVIPGMEGLQLMFQEKDGKLVSAEKKIPKCKLDGCGKCNKKITVTGFLNKKTFVITSFAVL